MENYSELSKRVQLFNRTDTMFFFWKKEMCLKLI